MHKGENRKIVVKGAVKGKGQRLQRRPETEQGADVRCTEQTKEHTGRVNYKTLRAQLNLSGAL